MASRKRKSRSWRVVKGYTRLKRVVRLFLLSIFALAAALLLMVGFAFYRFIKTPFAQSSSEGGLEISETHPFGINLVVLEDRSSEASRVVEADFVVINPLEKKVLVLKVPGTLSVDLPERYGENSFSKTFALGELPQKGRGIELVNKTCTKLLAEAPQASILTDLDSIREVSRLLGVEEVSDIPAVLSLKKIKEVPEALKLFKEGFSTDLSLSELAFLAGFMRDLPKENIVVREISQEDLVSYYELDKLISESSVDGAILSEEKRVLVLNGAGVTGLGSFAARFAENSGVSVVGVDNAPSLYEQSLIITDDLESYTFRKLSFDLGIGRVKRVEEAREVFESLPTRADITIIVGVDYASGM